MPSRTDVGGAGAPLRSGCPPGAGDDAAAGRAGAAGDEDEVLVSGGVSWFRYLGDG
ncbi:hypothetical protein AB4305_09935 [Nocardia sp. 2YAB30]|uniref:hypothetical protein n=1 Tax=unclassified Nocardia TaxID=2637762 RepID=UPI003F978B44